MIRIIVLTLEACITVIWYRNFGPFLLYRNFGLFLLLKCEGINLLELLFVDWFFVKRFIIYREIEMN
jgi:hypothetical protein